MEATKQALKQMIGELGSRTEDQRWAVTLNFHRETTPETATRVIRRWSGYVDAKLLGSKWAKKPSSERIDGLLVPEERGQLTNELHYHGVVTVAPRHSHHMFFAKATKGWKGLVASGTSYLVPIYDEHVWARYIVKICNAWAAANYVFLREFHTASR